MLVIGTFILAHLPAYVMTRRMRLPFFQTSTWTRWDSNHYIDIATRGYYSEYCQPPADTAWCGSTGWFPCYPLLARMLNPSRSHNPESRRKLRARGLLPAVGSTIGIFSVFAILQVKAGRWNAYFMTQGSYHHATDIPFINIARRIWLVADPVNFTGSVYRHEAVLFPCLLLTGRLRDRRLLLLVPFLVLAFQEMALFLNSALI